ncbi:hypothetical protein K8353_45165, partial [Burkholderia contaminans]|nr:hypothetical protein [Burkholderia contaminans]
SEQMNENLEEEESKINSIELKKVKLDRRKSRKAAILTDTPNKNELEEEKKRDARKIKQDIKFRVKKNIAADKKGKD